MGSSCAGVRSSVAEIFRYHAPNCGQCFHDFHPVADTVDIESITQTGNQRFQLV